MMTLSDIKRNLREYMEIPRLSGYEKEMAYRLRDDMKKYTDEVVIDTVGNCIATFRGTESESPALMVFAHMDVIGFIITRIDPDGFIFVDRMGGVPEKILPGTPVRVGSEDGTYYDGVFGTNLTYRTPELLSRPWFHEVDVSKYIAYFIEAINHDVSISKIIDPHSKIKELLAKYGVKGGDNI